jgi:hypothetical protein
MSDKFYYYEKYDAILNNPRYNPLFEDILKMSDAEFRDWVKEFRAAVVKEWDENGQPPRVGYNKSEIIANFRDMIKDHSLEWMETTDLITGEKNVIRNTTTAGNAVNQWFPTMMKTRITYGKNVSASRSIYDYFSREDLYETFVTYASRHFKRDSFYHYSTPISYGDIVPGIKEPITDSAQFLSEFKETKEWGYFLCPVKRDKKYTGFNSALKSKQNIIIPGAPNTQSDFSIRLYKKGQRLFPIGLKAFRVSFCQYAVNFPPLTARYLYEKYSDKDKSSSVPIIIYDPSSGWGGRLLGAMSINTDRQVLYVGTDPNTDHTLPTGGTKYQNFAKFFNQNIREQRNSLFEDATKYGHAYHIFQSGSETIGSHPDFQAYKGHVDIAFTSPPYFAKEVYSEDAEQSCHKFSQYEGWRDGFLRPTLETAVNWLKPGGYLLWNISDCVFGGEMLPLEKDSCDILKSLGMEYVETLKMSLSQMPGGNRLEETGDYEEVIEHNLEETVTKKVPIMKGKMKNFCEVAKESGKGKMFLKYEPIFVFRKRPVANDSQ